MEKTSWVWNSAQVWCIRVTHDSESAVMLMQVLIGLRVLLAACVMIWVGASLFLLAQVGCKL